MSLWKNLFGKEQGSESSNIEPEKNDILEDESKVINTRGIGTDNPIINMVYQDRLARITQWRNRYSKTEYPYKVLLNTVYQMLVCIEMWEYILNCFTQGKVYNDFQAASNIVQNKSGEVATKKVHPIVESTIRSGKTISCLNISLLNEIVAKAQKGDNKSVEEVELSYFWYTGAVEISYAYAALGLMGMTKMQALQQVSSLIIGGNPDDLNSALSIFGTNAEICYKKLPNLW